MAQAPRVRRATAATAAPVTNDAVNMDAEDAAAKAAAKAEEEARAAQMTAALNDLAGRMGDTLRDLKDSDAASAIDARLQWVKIGQLLREGQNLHISAKSNQVDDRAFGRWIVDNGFLALGARPARSSAMWLADVHDRKFDSLYALFPTESVDGTPLRRSPRTLQAWVRDEMYTAFQDAYEANSDLEIASTAEGDKDAKLNIAISNMPNVYDDLTERLASAKKAVDSARDTLDKAKDKNKRTEATVAYNAAADKLDAIQLRKSIFDAHDDGERANMFASWKPKHAAVAFKDCSVDDAADRLFSLLKTHKDFSAVYAALGALVEDHAAKVAANIAAAVDAGATDDGADVLDADIVEDGDDGDFDGDIVEEDGEDGDAFPE